MGCDAALPMGGSMFVRHCRYSDVHRNGRRTFETFNPVRSSPIPDRSGEAFFRHDPSLPPRVERVVYVNQFPIRTPVLAGRKRFRSRPEFVFLSGVRIRFFVRPPYFAPYDALRVIRHRTCVISGGPTSRVSVRYFIILLLSSSSSSSTSISVSLTCLLSISRSQSSAPVLRFCVPSRPTRTRTLLTRCPV
uniref:Uncharacterized protein n=1 Tax=Schizaphis graminum TaxID=13262 RepID=A0A2S2NNP1_SCHGA